MLSDLIVSKPFAGVHPDWVHTGLVYEVNLRSYTPEGTINAFARHLPRLKKLGVAVIWLMPVYPLGIERKIGREGGHYAVRNYTEVHPERGTLGDLQALVREAHALGMKVILDWVANHTSFDNPWIAQHPDWYQRDEQGAIRSPMPAWSDLAQLDVNNREMWRAMSDAMAFWVRECDVDGFRCDIADYVPVEFWEYSRARLEKIKTPLFYLAEADKPAYQRSAFNAAYGGMLWDFFHELRNGAATAADIDGVLLKEAVDYPPRTLMQRYVANHDSEANNGNVLTLFGPEALRAMLVLCYTLPGVPMLYNGIEAGIDTVISHFERGDISWDDARLAAWTPFLEQLMAFRQAHPALHADYWNGEFARILTSASSQVYAFRRTRRDDQVIVLINFSGKPVEFSVSRIPDLGVFRRSDTGAEASFKWGAKHALGPWEFAFFTK